MSDNLSALFASSAGDTLLFPADLAETRRILLTSFKLEILFI
jgi:hypothetical protein